MNQILFCNKKIKKNLIFIYTFFLLTLSIFISFSIYFISSVIKQKNNNNFSIYLSQKININNIYLNSNFQSSSNSLIIGTIEIPNLNIKYPVFSYYSDNLMKIGPCRLYGSISHTASNLCIIAHNYNNSQFFSQLYKLENNDQIKVQNNSGITLYYYVYNKYEVPYYDTSCTNQETYGRKELTLITCTNYNNKRLIIKAKSL